MPNPSDLIDGLRRAWARRAPTLQGALPRVEIDWRRYFEDFCAAHGRFPLFWSGRLLFSDGWAYGATDHAGPEWPPPADPVERGRLRRLYWRLRRLAVARDLPAARLRVEQIEQLLATHSVVPQQRSVFYDEDKEGYRVHHQPVDLESARQRVAWLEADLRICELRIVDPDAEVDNFGRLVAAEAAT